MQPNSPPNSKTERRGFFKQALALVTGAIVTLIPIGAGLAVFLDPLRRKKSASSAAIRVATLESIPADGTPVRFPVIATRTDAWNKFPRQPIGAIYLRRTGPKKVVALNVICPHAGCIVDFVSDNKSFFCPCHNSLFTVEGKRSEDSPSPRDLDTLEVEVRRGSEVWVKFKNFRTGQAEKVTET